MCKITHKICRPNGTLYGVFFYTIRNIRCVNQHGISAVQVCNFTHLCKITRYIACKWHVAQTTQYKPCFSDIVFFYTILCFFTHMVLRTVFFYTYGLETVFIYTRQSVFFA